MSEETNVLEPETEVKDQIDGDEVGLSAEDRAFAMGWTPKDQFRGDPDKWVDAETYIKRGEEYLPFVKANNRRLEREVKDANKRLAELETTIKEVRDFSSKAEERAYQRAMKDFEAELERAAEAGDVEGVKAVTADMRQFERDAAKAPQKTAEGDPPVLIAWRSENPWFEKDPALRGAAVGLAQDLIDKGMTKPEDYLPEVARRIKTEFPHKFENPARRQASAVEAPGAPARKGGKTFSDLPADAQATAARWEAQGLMTKAEYVKQYPWD